VRVGYDIAASVEHDPEPSASGVRICTTAGETASITLTNRCCREPAHSLLHRRKEIRLPASAALAQPAARAARAAEMSANGRWGTRLS
jgi:hypothetical protein